MKRKVTITNDEPEGAAGGVKVTVVTVGGQANGEQRLHLAGGKSAAFELDDGQFVMVEGTDKEGT